MSLCWCCETTPRNKVRWDPCQQENHKDRENIEEEENK